MMGRSHALLGAVGYLGVVALAKADVTAKLPIDPNLTIGAVAAVTVAARVSLSYMPAALYEGASPRRRLAPNEVDELEGIEEITYSRRSVAVDTGRRASQYVTGGLYGVFRKLFINANLVLIFATIAVAVGHYAPKLIPDSAVITFLWMLVCAGWALAPDIDEPNSTVSRLFGPVSRAASRVIRKLAGGHRQATHSFMAAGLGLILALIATRSFIVAGILMTIAMVLATRMIFPDSLGKAAAPVAVIGAVIAWMAAVGNVDMTPIVLAVPLGILLHLVGDYVTNSGVPVIWPHPQRYAAKFFGTNTRVEHLIVQPLLLLVLFLGLVSVVVIPGVDELSNLDTSSVSEFVDSIPNMGELSGSK